MPRRHLHLLLLWLACTLLALVSPARAANIEETPLKFSPAVTTAAEPNTPATSSAPISGTRMTLALGMVLALIFGLKWFGQRYLGSGAAGRPNACVRVLGRTPLAPKQQVLLLQVGTRVLVVADSHGRINALSEITEPDEVALLIGKTRAAAESEPKAGRFGTALRQAAEPFTAELPGLTSDGHDQPREPERADSPDVNGLLDRVRQMRQQFKSV